jgi:hypothetical protein
MPTVRDVVLAVRDILQDKDGDRYPDDDLIRILNMWVAELRRSRPDAFIGTFTQPMPVLDSLDGDLPFPVQFYTPTVHYVAGTAELRDDSFAVDGRANTLITLAKSEAGFRG